MTQRRQIGRRKGAQNFSRTLQDMQACHSGWAGRFYTAFVYSIGVVFFWKETSGISDPRNVVPEIRSGIQSLATERLNRADRWAMSRRTCKLPTTCPLCFLNPVTDIPFTPPRGGERYERHRLALSAERERCRGRSSRSMLGSAVYRSAPSSSSASAQSTASALTAPSATSPPM